jgi:hypothetical protein
MEWKLNIDADSEPPGETSVACYRCPHCERRLDYNEFHDFWFCTICRRVYVEKEECGCTASVRNSGSKNINAREALLEIG